MKNKRILTAIGICTLGAALTFGGCGKEKQKASEAAPKAEPAVTEAATSTPAPTAAPTATPTPVPLKTLGTKAEGAYEAVSYTHLDVYKRQRLTRASIQGFSRQMRRICIILKKMEPL